ncbi:MAG: DoxX family protein [Myxococcota bacterium]
MAISPLIASARVRAEAWLERLDWAAPLLARTTLGVLFMSTGWGKVHNLDKVTGFFTELGIPAPGFHAVLVSYTELVGGGLLLIGLCSRLAAVPLLVSMAVAIITAKRDEVGGLADLFGLVEWTYLALLAWVALAGPGRCSLDQFLFSKTKAARSASADSQPSFSAKPA